MDGRWHTVALGGMDEAVRPEPGSAARIRDMRFDAAGWWEPIGGALPVHAFPPGSGWVSSVKWFEPAPNHRFLVVERRISAVQSRISYADLSNGGYQLVVNRRRLDSVEEGTQFVADGRWLYLVSSTSRLERWDGRRVREAGFSAIPAAPRVASSDQMFVDQTDAVALYVYDLCGGDYSAGYGTAGFNQLTARGVGARSVDTPPAGARFRYGYAVSYINERGQESPLSPITWASGINDGIGRRLVAVHVGKAVPGVRTIVLWRTVNLDGAPVQDTSVGATVYRHSAFGGSFGFDLYDHKPDVELGPPYDPDETGLVPQGLRVLAFWKNHGWTDGGSSAPGTLRYSAPRLVEQWPEINTLPIGSEKSGPIVALVPFGNALFVLKAGGIFVVKGDAVAGFRVVTLSERHGCAAPRAVEGVPGVGVFFLDATGPHLVVGTVDDDQVTQVVPLRGLRKTWKRCGQALAGARSSFDSEHGEVWFQVPEGGDPRPTLGLVYHLHLKKWSLRTDWRIGAMDYYDGRLWLGSWDDTNFAGVYVLTKGSRTRFGSGVTGIYVTAPISSRDRFTFHRVEITGLGTGAAFTLDTRADWRPARTTQHETTPLQVYPEHDRDVWGSGLWGAAHTWYDYELAKFSVSVVEPGAMDHELRLTCARGMLLELALLTGKRGDIPNIQPRER